MMRKDQALYTAHLNQALRHTVAQSTIAQGARHRSKTVPAIAHITRNETKNDRRKYGIVRIHVTRKACVKLKESVGRDVGKADCMMVKSVTALWSVFSFRRGFSVRRRRRHCRTTTKQNMTKGKNRLQN